MNAQAQDALNRANEIRTRMAEAKRQIANRDLSARSLIGDPPSDLRRMKLIDVLQAVPKVGSYRAVSICTDAGVNPLSKLGELTVRNRLALLDGLDRYPSTREA